jgi:hypothetical protein
MTAPGRMRKPRFRFYATTCGSDQFVALGDAADTRAPSAHLSENVLAGRGENSHFTPQTLGIPHEVLGPILMIKGLQVWYGPRTFFTPLCASSSIGSHR